MKNLSPDKANLLAFIHLPWLYITCDIIAMCHSRLQFSGLSAVFKFIISKKPDHELTNLALTFGLGRFSCIPV